MMIYIIFLIILQGNKIVEMAKEQIKAQIENPNHYRITPISIPNNIMVKDTNYKINVEIPNKIKETTLVKVNIEGKSKIIIPLYFRIKKLDNQIVAKRRIKKNEIITEKDVQIKLVEENINGIHNLDEVIGKRASKTIPKGKIIEKDMIEKIPLVEKDQKIKVMFRKGSITIYVDGVAKKDGWFDDIIEVNLGKNLIKGKVIDRALVKIL